MIHARVGCYCAVPGRAAILPPMWTTLTRFSLLLSLCMFSHGCVDKPLGPWLPQGEFRCAEGQTVECACPLGGVGDAVCLANGKSLGPCTCPEVSDVVEATSVAAPEDTSGGGTQGGTTRTNPIADTSAAEDSGVTDLPDEEDTGPPPQEGGACVNEVQGTDVQGNLQSLEQDAWSQGTVCMESSPTDVVGCVQTGMVDTHGLSAGCALCFAGYVVCTMSSCSVPCSNYVSPQCEQCRSETCIPAWQVCMGL